MRDGCILLDPIWRGEAMRALSTLFALIVLAPASADAQELRWSERWTRVHPASYPTTSIAVSATLIFDQLYEPPEEATTVGPWLFDAAAQASLRAGTHDHRERAAALSDALLVLLLAWPVVDAFAVAGLGWGSSDVSWQLFSIATEVAALDFVLSTFVKAIVHRERPHGEGCTREDRRSRPDRCGQGGRTRSFYSGHASAAFSYAGAVCMAHAHLPLYGDVGADAFACGAALTTASMISVLRVVADRHWASDVIAGSLIGLATGLLLPYLLHYGWDPRDDDATAPGEAAPLLEAPASFSFSGTF